MSRKRSPVAGATAAAAAAARHITRVVEVDEEGLSASLPTRRDVGTDRDGKVEEVVGLRLLALPMKGEAGRRSSRGVKVGGLERERRAAICARKVNELGDTGKVDKGIL